MSKTLDLVSNEVSECTKCSLVEHRKQPVFGTGCINADLMFIGEGPGADEDLQGAPFVGSRSDGPRTENVSRQYPTLLGLAPSPRNALHQACRWRTISLCSSVLLDELAALRHIPSD